jgi:pimeloyl-ACP methyl ester carboxylesterase
MSPEPSFIAALVSRFDVDVFDARRRRTRIRLAVRGGRAWDAVLEDGALTVVSARGQPDALLDANAKTWAEIAADTRTGVRAYLAGHLVVRRNLHVGVGFLAATARPRPGRVQFRSVETPGARLSTLQAGEGPPVIAIHGLGGTKGSFLPTVEALADDFRVIALDLPGFGDSDKPIRAAYDAHFFADTVVDLLDALALDQVHLIGNSLGGRVALEIALAYPERVSRLALLAPSLAWLRDRPLLSLLRLTQPRLGLVQLAPRPVVQTVVHRLIPGADDGWTAAGVDEFLRAYLTPSGRAAFYAAARHIYIEEPHGDDGFWTRLPAVEADALFVWGRRDRLVPIAFARHVEAALPHARHVELDCGHVPQIESPGETHSAIAAFLSARTKTHRRPRFTRNGRRRVASRRTSSTAARSG